jgi:3-hydroxyisobutyrate dehydrogenase-like beta-hydroxyacid dehydrogenase
LRISTVPFNPTPPDHSRFCSCVGGFSLALGLKDVSLVSQAARETDTPMPFLSVLLDR